MGGGEGGGANKATYSNNFFSPCMVYFQLKVNFKLGDFNGRAGRLFDCLKNEVRQTLNIF